MNYYEARRILDQKRREHLQSIVMYKKDELEEFYKLQSAYNKAIDAINVLITLKEKVLDV